MIILKPIEEIKFTPDYKANEPTFWRVFNDLSKNNTGLVAYDKLQERLISTGKLDAGESVLMIEHMEKAGKIEKTQNYNIYKIWEVSCYKGGRRMEQYAIIMPPWFVRKMEHLMFMLWRCLIC